MTGERREVVDLAALSRAVAERLRADGRFEGATVIVDAASSAPVLGVRIPFNLSARSGGT
jgi:hypothetical protein